MVKVDASIDLLPGSAVVLDGFEWLIERFEPHQGRVTLVSAEGDRMTVNLRFLLNHPSCRQSSRTASLPADRGRQPALMSDLTPQQQSQARLRESHLLEMTTGFRSGDPLHPSEGEPKPCYDPFNTTLGQRRKAKVEELNSLDREHATMLGLNKISFRTLERWEARYQKAGIIGCVDNRWLRPRTGHASINEQIREAIYSVYQEVTTHRSKSSMTSKERLIHQYVREKYGSAAEALVPSYWTLRAVWHEWFGASNQRQRYARSAKLPARPEEHVVIHRPGQVVAMDTTVLPVKVRETLFGEPTSVHLTLAMDVYTRSMVAFRLTLTSEKSVDIAMMLRDMTMPLPMRNDWGEDMAWPYPGIPESVIAEFAGHSVAGLPFFAPEAVTIDHGSPFKNHDLIAAMRVLGTSVLPARKMRPQDKTVVERSFGSARSLLFENLLGYTGVDSSERGLDPEKDAILTIDAMEHLIATWIVKIWQNRRLGEHAPIWDPKGDHSPNTLFAAAMNQGGFAMQIPKPELYYELLPIHRVSIDRHRGVKINSLWYWAPILEGKNRSSIRGGKNAGKWIVRSDPRDARTTFFQDDKTHDWHTLRWTGLPAEGEVPAFSDARVEELLSKAKEMNLKPRTDKELLPILLDLIGAHIPVSSWPTQMSKGQRSAHARQQKQAEAAAKDRAAIQNADPTLRRQGDDHRMTATSPSWPQRARSAQEAVDSERASRRKAIKTPIAAPARLGSALQSRNLFALPDDPPSGETPEETEGEAS
jgi:hypothetical protein